MKLFLLQVLFCYMSTVIVDLSNCSPILTQKLVSVNQIILQHKPKYEVAGSYDHEKKLDIDMFVYLILNLVRKNIHLLRYQQICLNYHLVI